MRLVFALLLMTMSYSALATEKISLCSLERTGLSEADGTGYYWDVLRAAFTIEGFELAQTSAPFLRCLREVQQKRMDGVVAVFKTFERSKSLFYPKTRLGVNDYGLIFLKENSINKIEDVKSSVGIIRGYDFSVWLPSDLKKLYVNDTAQGLNMLKAKRIKYFVDDFQDVDLSMKINGMQKGLFSQKVFNAKSVYTAFTKNARGEKLAKAFSSGMRKIYKNGTLELLVKKYDIRNSIISDFK